MSNPFKKGDKVVARPGCDGVHAKHGAVFTVYRVQGDHVDVRPDVCFFRPEGPANWHYCHLRAAVAGQDYPVPGGHSQAAEYLGHLSDGSSVQKHSAGPIYPCVIRLRDQRLGGGTLFDYGVTSPRNQEPLWLSTLEAATALANIINKDLK